MSAVMKQESHAVAQTSESSSLLAVISRAASDPNVDLDKMERLLAMQERIVARQAEALFASALSEMQDELPSRSEEHTSELQSLMRISYAVFCLKKKKKTAKNE